MEYTELSKSLRICGEWGTEVRIPGEPSECDGCSYYNADKDECKSWDEPGRKEHLLLDAADAIEHLLKLYKSAESDHEDMRNAFIAEVEKHRWIPVEEKLPDFEGAVLCMRKSYTHPGMRYQEIMYGDENGFSNVDSIYAEPGNVTHWMPLPYPPKEETE